MVVAKMFPDAEKGGRGKTAAALRQFPMVGETYLRHARMILREAPDIAEHTGIAVVNSRDVAEKFEKRHDHVLRDIKALEISSDLSRSWFLPVDAVIHTGWAIVGEAGEEAGAAL
jgi:hypothetical protein